MMKLSILLLIYPVLNLSMMLSAQMVGLPKDAIEKAHEVVMEQQMKYTVKDIYNSYLDISYKAIIKDKYAEDLNNIEISYDQFREVLDAEVLVKELNGKVDEKFKLRDFEDYSTKGFSVASDGRVKYLTINRQNYPYIIEVSYRVKYNGNMFYPTWMPQSDSDQAILKSTFTVITPENLPFNYRGVNAPEPILTKEDGMLQYLWEVEGLEPFDFQNFSVRFEDYTPIVYTSPNQFQMEGVEGNMKNWQSFGNWITELNKNKNTLTAEDISYVRGLVDTVDNDYDKVKAVYQYMQNNTRYVSIQLGIGGWQPFDAHYVHENQFGDCKALSFYTMSLLESIGIPSNYTLIKAGFAGSVLYEEFPTSAFNHAILSVPIDQDTVWLECTSQTNPYGYMGTFTSDRDALAITDNGGQLFHTKVYDENDNIQISSYKVELQKNGQAAIKTKRQFTGIEIENNGYNDIIREESKKQIDWFYKYHKWGKMDIKRFDLEPISGDVVPRGGWELEADFENAGSVSGSRMFFKPFQFSNSLNISVPDIERTVPIENRYAFTQVDTIDVNIPEGMTLENFPKSTSFSSKFGVFNLSVFQEGNRFQLIRKFTFYRGRYPKEDYESFRTFIRKVQRMDRKRMVLLDRT